MGSRTSEATIVILNIRIDRVSTKLGFVEKIEELETKLHRHAFRRLEVLVNREVGISQSWALARTNSGVSERSELVVVQRPCGRIPPLVRGTAMVAAIRKYAVRTVVVLGRTCTGQPPGSILDSIARVDRPAWAAGIA